MVWTPEKEVNPSTVGIGSWSTRQIIEYRIREVLDVAAALRAASPQLERAVGIIVERVSGGGRVITIGAGGSGVAGMSVMRELPQNHRDIDPARFAYRVAGGPRIFEPFGCEEIEDDWEAGRKDAEELALDERDVLICISATGRTPYTRGAAEAARRRRTYCIGIVVQDDTELMREVDLPVVLSMAPEMFQGATCEKASSAQKDALDAVMDAVVVRLSLTNDNVCRARLVHEKARLRARFFDKLSP